jgi:hypothetical protein
MEGESWSYSHYRVGETDSFLRSRVWVGVAVVVVVVVVLECP